MKKYTQGLCLSVLLSFGVSAHTHTHGQGELLVAQDGHTLQMQFIIPADDALNVERTADSATKQEAINVLANKLHTSHYIVDTNGQCVLQSSYNSLNTEHEEHAHQNAHSDKSEDSHEHHDIEATYTFNCKTTVNRFSITLFELMPSLNSLSMQWINNSDQGLLKITRNQPVINWQS
ncbi:DUF2796 domain-containing protein [Pseudoalteromonas sp. MMG010]|uniref:ZrgA family zinc uptake protein n=1 Tax=Pseudoalteromonas sp. MMG010 TaxID=2822685 RepID=UPI001B39DE87|nr:DUF2796 domain-containing protein [Pseudoalteromonas sp. MMG010]MBQ4833614.1 DUF2796 domain-containing protein [Pseudoalteromonas sp. MMG010]